VPTGDPKPLFEIGMHHFGFWVDDLDAVHARARQASVPIILKPGVGDTAAYGEPSGGKVRTMFLRDPDGNAVQFDERA
jgi:catechol 2,3-dioxygenase-like lactoylglutathione lyase family enzyme